MELDDTITVATPEGLELALVLAGLGSRFIAGAIDLVIQGILALILLIGTGVTAGVQGGAAVVLVIGEFVIWLFYFVLFEMLGGGRSPGKRLTHLRVLRDTGDPIDLRSSLIRNLMRLIDGPTLLYLPSLVSVAVTRRNQRPGDLAAGTIVARELTGSATAADARSPAPVPAARPAAAQTPAGRGGAERWDASAVSPEETAAVRSFLERRDGLDADARRELAARLADGLRPKVTGARADVGAEYFLEELVRIKRSR